MLRKTDKIASVVIAIIIGFNGLFYFTYFKTTQYLIRKEIKYQIKQNIPDDKLTLIVITEHNKNELLWKHSKEFRYHGIMYDIVRKSDTEKATYYYCIADFKETTLFASLDNFVKNSMAAKGKIINNFLQNFYGVMLFCIDDLIAPCNEICIITLLYNNYISPYLKILSPPPEI